MANALKKLTAIILSAVMTVTACQIPAKEAKAAESINDPRIVADSSMVAGQKVTWDCIWFGSYPQTEIVDQASTSGAHAKDWTTSSDYEVNATLYNSLKSATALKSKRYPLIKVPHHAVPFTKPNSKYTSQNGLSHGWYW